MVFIVDLINDSVVLSSIEDFIDFTPEELYNEGGEDSLHNIIGDFITDYSKLEKMYNGDYNFTNEDLLALITQLNYIDNKYLIDMIIFSKYKKSEFIKMGLNE